MLMLFLPMDIVQRLMVRILVVDAIVVARALRELMLRMMKVVGVVMVAKVVTVATTNIVKVIVVHLPERIRLS